ncbi:UDP-N-acetylmuramoyl-tripeptide--D-alanyl-D-alanine ligase [Flavobacteriaceae bacterium F08102]|nr:UDP-N-acetylmuramoyl-tripeptide--D-alanyl-D-alanine ligase [Flavobacteriaceae bacterium F08102]
MNLETLYKAFSLNYAVSTDTRKIVPESLFFALKGKNFNGNKFAHKALDLGASLAVIDQEEYAVPGKTMVVEDVLTTLQELARYHRQKLGIPILALTGSNGKTTTKELIQAVLSSQYLVSATQGNLNNHIGVPLTLLRMTPQTEIGIVEMGANHPGEIASLCEIAQPDYGYITNFGKAHLEGFKSLEGVIKAKTELYRFLEKKNKIVFVNANDKEQVKQAHGMNQVIFGTEGNSAIALQSANPLVVVNFQQKTITSQLIGEYNFNNMAAAIAIGNYFKVDFDLIKKAIESYHPTNNRSQIIQKSGVKIILDAYNANPSSMQAALANFYQLSEEPKVVILGDMFELGSTASKEHQVVADKVVSMNLFKSVLIGENFYKTKDHPLLLKYPNFEAFANDFDGTALQGATVLIKGSRGMALERIVELIR